MKKNVGNSDKLIRLILAVVLFLIVYFEKVSGTTQYVLLVIALIAAGTSLINYCPLYSIFGINTCKNTK